MSRIAYVLTQDKGGPVDVAVRLAHNLIDQGDDEVRVFGPTPARDADLIVGYHEPILFGSKRDGAQARELRAAIRDWAPDIVHAQDRRAGLAIVGLDRRTASISALVHTYHGVPDDVSESWFRGERGAGGPSCYTRAVLAADAVVARSVGATVAPSTVMADFLHRRLRVPRRRLVHIDNGVALPTATPSSGPVRRLIFVGLLVPRKALLDLLSALDRPGVMPADATLTVVGDGEQRAAAEAFVTRSAIADRVEFLGFRSDVADLIAAHDALVLPSLMEQQPLVIAEAMGAGKMVVATDTGGVSEMLTDDGGSGFLATPGDVDDLVRQLRRLFELSDCREISATMIARARRRFDTGVTAQTHRALYAGLLDSRMPGSPRHCETETTALPGGSE
ncbi:glycosyltransferase family 4 protein [Gordonia polyisoprenivorans]|uniref:glycosyltransferase family 4 protein n=1 Tax=Gordonia polyisoprenivorans TaxID=84595 RepID=UPI0002EDEE45|nr:glycosyltransferase family 4 protein [Gordonia polyisoprenivorans]UZF57554.1 glycosyltransferase family 4 protein [Gordonia polyisoprenivorans]